MSLRCLPSSFGSIRPTVWEMSFEKFQDGSHLGYRNSMILAILNLYNAQMPPIKFRLNLTWFGRRCCLKNFKMAAMANGTNLAIPNFCVIVTPPMKFLPNPNYGMGGDVVWRISRWQPRQPSCISEWMILAILNLCVTVMPPIKFQLNPTYMYGLGGA